MKESLGKRQPETLEDLEKKKIILKLGVTGIHRDLSLRKLVNLLREEKKVDEKITKLKGENK